MNKDRLKVEHLLKNPWEIKFAYQPIYRLSDDSIYGYEALMRPYPFTPSDFIKQVDDMDMLYRIEEITNYYGVKCFMEAGLEGKIFLNSFPSVCMRIQQAKEVAALGGDVMKNRLIYEVLEYTRLEKYAWEMKKVAFNTEGATPLIAIDDFGTGSNFDRRCLDFYRPDLVKIDRRFVSNVDKDFNKQHTVNEIIEELKDRDIMILAEGIETKEEYNYFKHMRIDLAQGYYLGMPKIYSED